MVEAFIPDETGEKYDRMTAEQIRRDREYEQRPFKEISLDPLFDALIADAMEGIKESNIEIGVFRKCRETFRDSPNSVAYADMFIKTAQFRIERDYEDIQRWRSCKAG